MNHLAIIKKHVKGIESSWAETKTEETRNKVRVELGGLLHQLGLNYTDLWYGYHKSREAVSSPVQSVSRGVEVVGAVSVTEASNAVSGVFVDQGGASSGWVGVTTTSVGGATIVYPVDYKPIPEEPAVEGDVGGTGTFYSKTVQIESVPEIGGWPVSAVVGVIGLAPNRRSIKGKIEDGRVVSVERSFGRKWEPGIQVKCRLVRAGISPLYRGM